MATHKEASEVHTRYLQFTQEQEGIIEAMYKSGMAENMLFKPLDDNNQIRAAAILTTIGLDTDTRESLKNQWSIQWLRVTGKGKTEGVRSVEQTEKVLFQWSVSLPVPKQTNAHIPCSDCGYNT
jgi:hypothetical protein